MSLRHSVLHASLGWLRNVSCLYHFFFFEVIVHPLFFLKLLFGYKQDTFRRIHFEMCPVFITFFVLKLLFADVRALLGDHD